MIRATRLRGVSTLAAALLILAAGSGCGDSEAEAEKAAAPPPPPPPVVVVEIGTTDVPVLREFVARTEAKDTVAIQARVEAILESMHFEEGRPVKQGQLLYELDKQTYQAQMDAANAEIARSTADLKLAREQVSVRAAEAALVQAEAGLKKAKQDVARLKPLAEADAVPQQDLDTAVAAEEVAVAEVSAQEANLENSRIREEVGVMQAEAALKTANAALVLAKLDLEYCTIKCPLDGRIGRTDVSVGNLVGRGEATDLATVSSMDPMYVTFAISDAEYLGIVKLWAARGESKEKKAFELLLADDSVYGHTGVAVTAEADVATETGTLQLVASFPNPDGNLRPGQFGRVRIAVTLLENALLVPQRAVMEQQGAKVVLVVGEGDKVALRTIRVSERHEGSYVVIEGLEAGERVILEGQLKARPGSIVKPTTKSASTEPDGE